MTSEEKIAKLQELFKQKEAVDKEISEMIGGEATPMKRKARVLKKTKSAKIRRSNAKRLLEPYKVKPKKERKPRMVDRDYQCLDCKQYFKSDLPKLDVTCPNCNSTQIISSGKVK